MTKITNHRFRGRWLIATLALTTALAVTLAGEATAMWESSGGGNGCGTLPGDTWGIDGCSGGMESFGGGDYSPSGTGWNAETRPSWLDRVVKCSGGSSVIWTNPAPQQWNAECPNGERIESSWPPEDDGFDGPGDAGARYRQPA